MELTGPEMEARNAGFPSSLFGYSPNDFAYWFEPELPWLIHGADSPPLDRRGWASVVHLVTVASNAMAPRFPEGCIVNLTPVYERQFLTPGRVYVYRYPHSVTGQVAYKIGRLVKVHPTHLEVTADNDPTLGLWPLRETEAEVAWDVYEVTHAAQYPGLS